MMVVAVGKTVTSSLGPFENAGYRSVVRGLLIAAFWFKLFGLTWDLRHDGRLGGFFGVSE